MEYMTTKEASERWGYSEATIRKWCKEGLLFTVQKAEKRVVAGKYPLVPNVHNL